MLSNCGVYRVKAAQELYFLFCPSVHFEPAFQAVCLLETGHVETYEIGGTIRFVDLENSGFHTGTPFATSEAMQPRLCYL